jgi:hypothetical protein
MKLKTVNDKIVEATCDICGEDCMQSLYTPKASDVLFDSAIKEFEGMELKATWGFGTKKDGEIWNAIVCEKCVDKHLSKLINFLKTSYF